MNACTPRGRDLSMAGVTREKVLKLRSAEAQSHVEARVEEARCLFEDCTRSFDENGGGRGRCSTHYGRFKLEVFNLPTRLQAKIEKKHVAEGTLLLRQEIRLYRSTKWAG